MSSSTSKSRLYRHTKRPEWGFAILAWEEGDRRAFQFDDGKLRVFKRGYFELMQPDDSAAAAAEDGLIAELEKEIPANNRKKEQRPLNAAYPFETQLKIFSELYPDGFQGEAWTKYFRDSNSSESRKREREPSMRLAREKLSEVALAAHVATQDWAAIRAAAVEVLQSSDLAAAAQVRELAKMPDEGLEEFGVALQDMLYGDSEPQQKFKQLVHALRTPQGKSPSWRMATSLPALVHPDEWVCIRASTYRRQAAVFEPTLLYNKKPRWRSYVNFKKIAEMTRDALVEAGLKPRDFLDVHDFVWVTLRPAAAKLVK